MRWIWLWWIKHAHLNLRILLLCLLVHALSLRSSLGRRLLRWWRVRLRHWSISWEIKVILLRHLWVWVLIITTFVWLIILCGLSEELRLWGIWWTWPFSQLLIFSTWVVILIDLSVTQHLLPLLSCMEFRILQLRDQLWSRPPVMLQYLRRNRQVNEVVTVSILLTQILMIISFLVSPHKFRFILNIWRDLAQINQWSLLWVHVRIAQNKFFIL